MTFNQAKDEIGKKYSCSDWGQLMAKIQTDGNFRFLHGITMGVAFDEAALLYGDSQWNGAIEKAIELSQSEYGNGLIDLLEQLKKLKKT